jgi:uncharacterized membrane protein
MEFFAVARVIHVLGVVVWIGGVWFVTTIIIPSVIEKQCDVDSVKFFKRVEGRFSWQAGIAVLLTGISGLYMLYVTDTWSLYLDKSFWWFSAMTLVWLLFSLMIFVLEPLVLHRWFERAVEQAPQKAFQRMKRLHWVLLSASLVTIAGAVAGSHGWLWV